jgi:hypothetical protein
MEVTMTRALLIGLVLILPVAANAQCYDRPAWHGSGYNWNGGHGGYYEPYYTYHYRSYSYRSWHRHGWDWD